jgi:hypothetical protein
MPKLGHFRKKKVYLPSFDSPKDKAWVEVALDFPVSWSVDAKEGEEAGLEMLAKIIVAWNLTDDTGKVAPINKNTVTELNHTDQRVIIKAIGLDKLIEEAKLGKDEKKS